jgi:hypothetical protein
VNLTWRGLCGPPSPLFDGTPVEGTWWSYGDVPTSVPAHLAKRYG